MGATPDGVVLDVRVIPRAKKTEMAGERDGALVVRVAAPPVEGAANDALIDFFAAALRIPRRAIRIVAGAHGRRKRVAIEGVTIETIRALTVRP
ncbi:MAG TPA: DUF167 domain-containing protein [Vicinamibacterales bacterium]|nr:DUF167 domain-containing protein [Vicinamibacterales bacterium]